MYIQKFGIFNGISLEIRSNNYGKIDIILSSCTLKY